MIEAAKDSPTALTGNESGKAREDEAQQAATSSVPAGKGLDALLKAETLETVAQLTGQVMCQATQVFSPQLRPRVDINIRHPECWNKMGLAAAVLWGCTTLVLRGSRLATALPEKTLLYQLAVSGVALTAAGLLKGEVWPATLTTLSIAALAFQTVVITFASYLVWFWLLRHYPATRISAFVLLTPVFGLLAGVLLLNEPLTTRLVVALAAVCVGIALVNRPARTA